MKWVLFIIIGILSAVAVSAVCEVDWEQFEQLDGLNVEGIPLVGVYEEKAIEFIISDTDFNETYIIQDRVVQKIESSEPRFLLNATSCVIRDIQTGELSALDAYHKRHVSIEGRGFTARTSLFFARVGATIAGWFR